MRNKAEEVLIAIGVIMVVAITVTIIAVQYNECNGTLVRGLFWFECIRGG